MKKDIAGRKIIRSVVFYDGECPLCNKVVNYLSGIRDLPEHLRFSGQSGDLYVQLKSKYPFLNDIDSLVYVEYFCEEDNTEMILRHSGDAVTRLLGLIDGRYRFFRWLYRIAPSWGDRLYRKIASGRYTFYGGECPVPPRSLLERMI